MIEYDMKNILSYSKIAKVSSTIQGVLYEIIHLFYFFYNRRCRILTAYSIVINSPIAYRWNVKHSKYVRWLQDV